MVTASTLSAGPKKEVTLEDLKKIVTGNATRGLPQKAIYTPTVNIKISLTNTKTVMKKKPRGRR